MSSLHFQDFNTSLSDSAFPTQSTNKLKSTSKENISGRVGDATEIDTTAKKPHFLTFGFYQQFFDVDTTQVHTRILHSFLPVRNSNFITDHIQPVPDLYGPFWICVTLIFSIAIFGNLAHYVQNTSKTYDNDFGLVTSATTLIFCYVTLVPFAIYSFLWNRKSVIQYSYMEMLCAYGYSLAIFIPVSMLWVIQIPAFRWLLIIVSVIASGILLVNCFWPAVKNDSNRLVAFGFIAVILFLHTLLAVGFKEFYFDTSMPVNIVTSAPKNIDLPTVLNKSLVGSGVHNAETKPVLKTKNLELAVSGEMNENNSLIVKKSGVEKENLSKEIEKRIQPNDKNKNEEKSKIKRKKKDSNSIDNNEDDYSKRKKTTNKS